MDRPSDVEPTYLIMGGLVFVPLSAEFLSSWGATGSVAHLSVGLLQQSKSGEESEIARSSLSGAARFL